MNNRSFLSISGVLNFRRRGTQHDNIKKGAFITAGVYNKHVVKTLPLKTFELLSTEVGSPPSPPSGLFCQLLYKLLNAQFEL